MPYRFRKATQHDMVGVAGVFASGFPGSLTHYFDRPPRSDVVAEPFALCLASEPEGFFVADDGQGNVAGYIFAPAKTSRLPWVALRHGFAFRWAWQWLTGRLDIGMAPVRALTLNKVDFLTSARKDNLAADARILSIAVHPDHQGKGIARALCELGLKRLDDLGASPVRLEVRPENTPAVRLYTRLGFRVSGQTRDSQGEWLIMLRRPPGLA